MQAKNERESRFLHDQLAVLAPILMALSASTPIHRGQIANTDTRWDVISQAVDDRTAAERGLLPPAELESARQPGWVGGGVRRLRKSRYSSVSRYIGKPLSETEHDVLCKLNDVDADIDEEAYHELCQSGIDRSVHKIHYLPNLVYILIAL